MMDLSARLSCHEEQNEPYSEPKPVARKPKMKQLYPMQTATLRFPIFTTFLFAKCQSKIFPSKKQEGLRGKQRIRFCFYIIQNSVKTYEKRMLENITHQRKNRGDSYSPLACS